MVKRTSLGLSSTNKISTACSSMGGLSSEGKVKRRTVVDRSLGPDAPAMAMNNALHNRQAYTGPFILFGPVQALEHPEQFVHVGHIETGAVVLDKIDVFFLVLLAAHFDDGHGALLGKLERVGEQVDKDLLEQDRVALTY